MLSTCTYPQLAGSAGTTPRVSTHTRILIADDDRDTRELIELAVSGPGVELYTASDGMELLDLIAECAPFDLIVTDINMPWIEGLQVLASIREAGLDTPVLVVSGLDRPDLATTVTRMRNAILLRKPFEIADLRQAIATLLGDP